MTRVLILALIAFVAIGCSSSSSPEQDSPSFEATPSPRAGLAVTRVVNAVPTATSTPSPNAVQTALMVLEFDRATSTALAAAQGTQHAVRATEKAEATQAFWVNVTMVVSTERAVETQVAKTETAGTKQAEHQTAVPLTETARIATQTVENDALMAERVSIWMFTVGSVAVGLAAAGIALYFALIGVRAYSNKKNAEVFKIKTDALKPDAHGRRAAVPSSEMKPGERLIIPDLAHRSLIDPSAADDLTAAQALQNASDQRKLEAVRALSESPVMPAMLRRMADTYVKQTSSDIQITKPDQPPTPANPLLETSELPALPLPHFKELFHWDGKLLPYGMSEAGQLMRVDHTIRPHFIIVGRSRSGKTLSSIRPMAACLLTMGWNVIVMGKRVDFMPFEDHHNFKLIAVDVRKDARKYINTLKVLTDQMDIRDQILSPKGISTWDLYGAPPTMVVIDDYSGAILRMPKKEAVEVLNEVKSIAFDGAKFGLHLMLGLQRATWENIDTNLRSQMGRIVYSLESAGDSRVALGEDGAERLPPQWNFLTRMTDDAQIHRGVGFALQDQEIEAFLHSRPVPKNEPVEWVEAEVTEDVRETSEPPIPSVNDVEARILELHHQGKKPSVIIREIWGITGGGRYAEKSEQVKSVLTRHDTSSSSEGMPQNEILGAI